MQSLSEIKYIKNITFLTGDLGGTKTLLAIYSWDGGLKKIHQTKYISNDWDSFESILNDFILNLPKDINHPSNGCMHAFKRSNSAFIRVYVCIGIKCCCYKYRPRDPGTARHIIARHDKTLHKSLR